MVDSDEYRGVSLGGLKIKSPTSNRIASLQNGYSMDEKINFLISMKNNFNYLTPSRVYNFSRPNSWTRNNWKALLFTRQLPVSKLSTAISSKHWVQGVSFWDTKKFSNKKYRKIKNNKFEKVIPKVDRF